MFNRVNINEGKKHDTTQVAAEGLSEEEVLKATKKKKSLINIYKAFDQNKDGKLDKTEIAAAMKLIGSMDDNENGKLSRKELKEGAVNLNEIFKEEELDVDRKDVKNFLRSMVKTMKDHEMVSTDSVIEEYVEKTKAEAMRQATPPTAVAEENPVAEQKPQEKPKPAELHSYTVQEGESFTGLIKRSLKAQGIENPTDAQIKEAKEKFKKDNDGMVRKSSKGVEFLPVGAKVKLEGNLGDKNNAAEQIQKYEKEHGAPSVTGNTPAKGDAPVRSKTISFTNKDHKTFEELATALFKREGIDNPSKEQIKQRVEELKNDNKDLKDGDLVNKKIKAKVSESMHDRISKNEVNKKPQVGRNGTVAIVSADVTNAKKAFLDQLDNDGWAGKTADAVSFCWGSDNRESKVREDFKKYETQLSDLRESAKKGDADFKAKFKEIYGIECNYENITKYKNDPTSANYIKAFGTKNNAGVRVADYNDSQQRGASAVKTTAVGVVSGVAAVATGGTSLLATAAIVGGSTAAGRVAAEVIDMATNNKEGDMTSDKMGEVAKQAMVEGLVAGTTAGLLKGASSMLSKGVPKSAGGVAGTADDVATVTKGGLVKAGGVADDAAVAAERRLLEVKPETGKGSPKAIGEAPKGPKGTGGADVPPRGAFVNGTKQEFSDIFSKLTSKVKLSASEIKTLESNSGFKFSELQNLTKKQYREFVVKFHPDKLEALPQAEREAGEELFKIIQLLYNY